MNKFIILIISATLTISCKEKKENKYLYQFDKVEHFKLNIDESKLFNSLDNPQKLTTIQENEASIVFDDSPRTMKDTLILESIEKEDFNKSDINIRFNSQINEILKENHKKRDESTKCAPIYRDLLILKRNNKKVGIVKICFECGKIQFTGTKLETSNFGTKGELQKIEEIINKKF